MTPMRFHLAYRNIKRLRTIVTVFVRHGFHPLMESLRLGGLVSLPVRVLRRKLAREEAALSAPARARLALEELGPTFIKLGQILSTRPDIVPHEYIIEFLKLQDSVAPIPFSQVKSVIEAEFKRPLSELFSEFDEEAVAAASIAQVHRARTPEGVEVIVKVQRPGIEALIDLDTSILAYIAKLALKYIPESRLYDPEGMVEEFSRVLRREMDFTLEASYTERFRENFSGDARVVIPSVFWDITARRVLTLEKIDGIKIDNVQKLREKSIDTASVAILIADVFFRQVFEFGIFHGDLHSGNIFVISEDKIALVDFGIVGRIDNEMKQHLADILISFASEDFERLTRVYQRMGILPEDIDRASFEREYYDIMLRYFGRPFKHVRMGELLLDYIRLAARHDIRLPRDLLLFDKCIIELEGLGRLLHPDIDIIKESQPYATRLYVESMSPGTVIKDAARALSDYRDLAERFPIEAARILKKIDEGKIGIEFKHRGLEEFMGEMDRSSNRLTFAIIIAALIVGSSLVIAAEAAPTIFGLPALGVLGFIIASILGLWLAFQIIRSGKF